LVRISADVPTLQMGKLGLWKELAPGKGFCMPPLADPVE
jgi:hypothetical protein